MPSSLGALLFVAVKDMDRIRHDIAKVADDLDKFMQRMALSDDDSDEIYAVSGSDTDDEPASKRKREDKGKSDKGWRSLAPSKEDAWVIGLW